MDIKYTPSDATQLIPGVKSTETIRTWSQRFADFLTPDANPGPGQHRRFTPEDMEILHTVFVLSQGEGRSLDEAYAAITAGTRYPLTIDPENALAAGERSEIVVLQARLDTTLAELAGLHDTLNAVRTERDKALGALENADKLRHEQVDDLRNQLKEANEHIRSLYVQIAKLEAKGDGAGH